MTTNETIATARAAQIQRHFDNFGNKGFANEGTMRRANRAALQVIETEGLSSHFEIVTIAVGKHAGRVVPALTFAPGEEIPSEAVDLAHAGILLFRYRS